MPGKARLKFPIARAWVAAALLVTGGCASAPINSDRAGFARFPSRNAVPASIIRLAPEDTLLLDVRLDRQQASNSCGAHAVAAVIDYWARVGSPPTGVGKPTGLDLYAARPPGDPRGYSVGEVAALLQDAGLASVAVATTRDGIGGELLAGRPVIARVSLSAGHLAAFTLVPSGTPLLGLVQSRALDVAARLLEPWPAARIDHYWVVVGQGTGHVIVLDPILGLRSVREDAFARAFERGGRLAVVSGGWA